MDIKPQNIKMCEKAWEIQKDHKWEYGDWLVAEHGVFQIGTASFDYDIGNGTKPPIRSKLPIATIQAENKEGSIFTGNLIWLPHQDQLQERYLKHLSQDEQDSSNIMVVILDDFQDWVLNDCTGLDWTFGKQVSMEQLWLAFVMRELYNKIWKGEDWDESS